MKINLNDHAIKKLRTKRLLQYGTSEPVELFQAIDELKAEMMFELFTHEMFERWIQTLRHKMHTAVELQFIKDYSINWSKKIDSDIIELNVGIKENATTEVKQFNITISH